MKFKVHLRLSFLCLRIVGLFEYWIAVCFTLMILYLSIYFFFVVCTVLAAVRSKVSIKLCHCLILYFYFLCSYNYNCFINFFFNVIKLSNTKIQSFVQAYSGWLTIILSKYFPFFWSLWPWELKALNTSWADNVVARGTHPKKRGKKGRKTKVMKSNVKI